MASIAGAAAGLTVLTPIVEGDEEALRDYLETLKTLPDSPLRAVTGTHFARWVIVHDVRYQGAQQQRDSLQNAYLLFSSTFDGDRDSYLYALCTGLGEVADRVWGHCVGYPGRARRRRFADYLRHNSIESSFFFMHHDATVDEIRRSIDIRRRVIDFAASVQGTSPEALQQDFCEKFADLMPLPPVYRGGYT